MMLCIKANRQYLGWGKGGRGGNTFVKHFVSLLLSVDDEADKNLTS